MMKLRVAIVLTAVAVSLLACTMPAEFAAPISRPGSVEHDSRLVGSWYALAEDDAVVYLNIGVSREGLLNAVTIMADDKPDHFRGAEMTVFWLAATAWPSAIDGELYFNIKRKTGFGNYYKEIDEESGKPGFIVARAEFPDDDTLRLTAISSDKIAVLIRDGRVPGQVEENAFYNFSRADIGGAELQTLIRSYPAEQLFQTDPAVFVFKRLKPTVVTQPPEQ